MRQLVVGLIVMACTVANVASAADAARMAPPKALNSDEEKPSKKGEDWKGEFSESRVTIGASVGLGIIANNPGFSFYPNIATKILQPGFIPDLNDTLWIEAEAGPGVANGTLYIGYSAHLRWDFEKNDSWTFFGLGGFGGWGEPSTSRVAFYPRFGIGAFFKFLRNVALRGEVTNDFIGVGVDFFIP